jgi:sarcosine oxidase subunit alpha
MGDRVTHVHENVVTAVQGRSTVKSVAILQDQGKKKLETHVVGVATHSAPAFELAAQAGATVRFDAERGYAIECAHDGRAGDGLWAVGECTGLDFEVDAIVDAAERCARAIAS